MAGRVYMLQEMRELGNRTRCTFFCNSFLRVLTRPPQSPQNENQASCRKADEDDECRDAFRAMQVADFPSRLRHRSLTAYGHAVAGGEEVAVTQGRGGGGAEGGRRRRQRPGEVGGGQYQRGHPGGPVPRAGLLNALP